jgi:Fe-S-cluster containining protein
MFMPDERLALLEHLRQELDAYDQSRPKTDDGRAIDDYGQPCIWLKSDGTCRHYEHRPQVCRDFEVGCKACLRFRETWEERQLDEE